nr:uncharacterized protein LOC113824760 isoform X3 [Penaeus vannamei]
MKVTLILVLVAVVGLSSAYSLGDVYEKLHRVERDMSSNSWSNSVEDIEKRDISGNSFSNSVEDIEKRDISGNSFSNSVEDIEKRDISGAAAPWKAGRNVTPSLPLTTSI